jgi:hypothetical protein
MGIIQAVGFSGKRHWLIDCCDRGIIAGRQRRWRAGNLTTDHKSSLLVLPVLR